MGRAGRRGRAIAVALVVGWSGAASADEALTTLLAPHRMAPPDRLAPPDPLTGPDPLSTPYRLSTDAPLAGDRPLAGPTRRTEAAPCASAARPAPFLSAGSGAGEFAPYVPVPPPRAEPPAQGVDRPLWRAGPARTARGTSPARTAPVGDRPLWNDGAPHPQPVPPQGRDAGASGESAAQTGCVPDDRAGERTGQAPAGR